LEMNSNPSRALLYLPSDAAPLRSQSLGLGTLTTVGWGRPRKLTPEAIPEIDCTPDDPKWPSNETKLGDCVERDEVVCGYCGVCNEVGESTVRTKEPSDGTEPIGSAAKS